MHYSWHFFRAFYFALFAFRTTFFTTFSRLDCTSRGSCRLTSATASALARHYCLFSLLLIFWFNTRSGSFAPTPTGPFFGFLLGQLIGILDLLLALDSSIGFFVFSLLGQLLAPFSHCLGRRLVSSFSLLTSTRAGSSRELKVGVGGACLTPFWTASLLLGLFTPVVSFPHIELAVVIDIEEHLLVVFGF